MIKRRSLNLALKQATIRPIEPDKIETYKTTIGKKIRSLKLKFISKSRKIKYKYNKTNIKKFITNKKIFSSNKDNAIVILGI